MPAASPRRGTQHGHALCGDGPEVYRKRSNKGGRDATLTLDSRRPVACAAGGLVGAVQPSRAGDPGQRRQSVVRSRRDHAGRSRARQRVRDRQSRRNRQSQRPSMDVRRPALQPGRKDSSGTPASARDRRHRDGRIRRYRTRSTFLSRVWAAGRCARRSSASTRSPILHAGTPPRSRCSAAPTDGRRCCWAGRTRCRRRPSCRRPDSEATRP